MKAKSGRIGEDLALHGWPVVATRHAPHDAKRPRPAKVTHDYAAIAFYTGGRARMEQRVEWSLEPGDVLLLPAGEPHRMLAAEQAEYWGLALCVPCFSAHGPTTLLEPIDRVRDGGAAVVRIPLERRAFLGSLFEELTRVGAARRGPSDALDAVQRSLLTLIMAEIDRAAASGAPRDGRAGVVAESLRFIERRCLGKLTLAEIASAVGRSPTYVTAALTRATGRSAGEWIVAGRMAEARRLLLHSDEMVDVIAERVGYADATHFIRMFRRAHGATPAAWRAARSHAR